MTPGMILKIQQDSRKHLLIRYAKVPYCSRIGYNAIPITDFGQLKQHLRSSLFAIRLDANCTQVSTNSVFWSAGLCQYAAKVTIGFKKIRIVFDSFAVTKSCIVVSSDIMTSSTQIIVSLSVIRFQSHGLGE